MDIDVFHFTFATCILISCLIVSTALLVVMINLGHRRPQPALLSCEAHTKVSVTNRSEAFATDPQICHLSTH